MNKRALKRENKKLKQELKIFYEREERIVKDVMRRMWGTTKFTLRREFKNWYFKGFCFANPGYIYSKSEEKELEQDFKENFNEYLKNGEPKFINIIDEILKNEQGN